MKLRSEYSKMDREYKMVRIDSRIYDAMKKYLDEQPTYCSATRFIGDLVESKLILESQKAHQGKKTPI